MTNANNGIVYAMVAPPVKTTVTNPQFMIRDDGMVSTFNADVWAVDQRGKKRLRCVAALPASYINRLNDLKRKRILQEAQQAAYANQFKLKQQEEKAEILRRAEEAHMTLQDIAPENLVADGEYQEHIGEDNTFYLSTASKDDMIAYVQTELHLNDWPDMPEAEMRTALAEMLGVEL